MNVFTPDVSPSPPVSHLSPDGVVRVPSAVAQRVQTEMQAIRMAIFKLLEPLLKCKLGKNLRAYVFKKWLVSHLRQRSVYNDKMLVSFTPLS